MNVHQQGFPSLVGHAPGIFISSSDGTSIKNPVFQQFDHDVIFQTVVIRFRMAGSSSVTTAEPCLLKFYSESARMRGDVAIVNSSIH